MFSAANCSVLSVNCAGSFVFIFLPSKHCGHLCALIAMTNGDAGETFRCYNDTIQDEFMESCGLLAKECAELFSHLRAKVAA